MKRRKNRIVTSDSDDEEDENIDLQNKDELEATASGLGMDQQPEDESEEEAVPECESEEEAVDDQTEGFNESEFNSNSFPSLVEIWKETRSILAAASEDKVQADISIETAELRLGQ
jgi:hypothetical protein